MKYSLTAILFVFLANPAISPVAYAQSLNWVEMDAVRVCPATEPIADLPDFDAPECETMPLHGVNPQGRMIWIAASLMLSESELATDRPLGLFVSGAMSTSLYMNGTYLGQNGQAGQNRASEIPGAMDSVVFVPPSTLHPGNNELVLLMSAHHSLISFEYPIHIVALGEFAGPTERIIRAYWPSLINFGVFLLGIIIFGVSAVRGDDRENGVILALLALFVTAQLVTETSRGLISYAYPMHAWRMLGVTGFAAMTGLLFLAHVLKRFSTWRWTFRWGLSALVSLVVVAAIWLAPSYDPKAIFALFIPIGIAIPGLVYRGLKTDRNALIYLGLIAAVGIAYLIHPRWILDVYVYYFFSALMLVLFFQQALALIRARRSARSETARAERLQMALQQAHQKSDPAQLQLTSAGKMERIDTGRIAHIQAAGDYIELHFKGGKSALFTSSLNEIEAKLPDTFLRVHRSHIVNTAFIDQLERHASGVGRLTLSSGAEIPVSRRIMPSVRSALAD
ncbi:LytTR family DNA-binding domain-containing protein [Hyphobacterium indicum]|uniref:LytTR family DNA-binding domain-containing protein n=1 Tax=Hyphobacterium indicum TaxID=2162714 RepID=UPI000D6464EB|nr:LytTR family DNA-binding domain-containing protein [Hyphobacterium indicum]